MIDTCNQIRDICVIDDNNGDDKKNLFENIQLVVKKTICRNEVLTYSKAYQLDRHN